MKLWLILVIPFGLAASSMDGVYESWTGTVNGVGWRASYSPVGNYTGIINAQFTAPISFYDFTVTFWDSTVGAQVWIPSQFSQVNVIDSTHVEGLGYPADITQLSIEIGFARTPLAPDPPKGFTFTNLVDPPNGGTVGIAETPEPTSWVLMGLGLLATARATRWWSRSSKLA